MIPRRLRLKNFLSFAEPMQELDFDQFQVVCMVGSNGAGKSSLIEAISWCVWGKGRAKSGELMHEGSQETRVEYEFNLQQDRYRIIRILKRKKKGSPNESLEFQAFNSSTPEFIALTEASKTATQEKILRFVGITYEVFMNSAFIVQGRASEFSLKNPNQRKEILIKILQIDRYNALSELAQKKALELSKEISKTQGKIETLAEELEQTKSVEEKVIETETEFKASSECLDKAKQAFQEAETHYETLRVNQLQYEKTSDRLQTLLATQEDIRREKLQKEKIIGDIHDLLKDSETLNEKKQNYDELQMKLEKEETLQKQARQIEREIQQLSQKIEQSNMALANKKTWVEQNLSRLAQSIQTENLKLESLQSVLLELEQIEQTLKTHDSLEEDIQSNNKRVDTLKDEMASIKHQLAFCEEEMAEITRKGKTIKDLKDPNCPLCKTPLDEMHKSHILEEYRTSYKSKQELRTSLQVQFTQKEQALSELSEQEMALVKRKDEKIKLEQEQALLKHRKNELAERQTHLKKLEAEHNVAQEELEGLNSGSSTEHLNAEKARIQLQEFNQSFERIGYSEENHNEIRIAFKALQDVPQKLVELKHARDREQELSEEVKTLNAKLEKHETEKALLQAEISKLEIQLAEKTELENNYFSSKEALSTQQNRFSELEFQLRQLRQKKDELNAKKQTRDNLQKAIAEKSERKDIYDFLKTAFGVNGIQSLIIENAVPELEAQANVLLTKLSHNQMSLMLRTQRELASQQKTVESLEIDISDATGTIRDYNTFSGGERFRIDLALRIALSKMLAAQSGVSIKMLIIDEGFGTQDEEGLEVIIDSIDRISDEFEKIIMITHLDKLRDAFEVKITVKKEVGIGSRFTVATAS